MLHSIYHRSQNGDHLTPYSSWERSRGLMFYQGVKLTLVLIRIQVNTQHTHSCTPIFVGTDHWHNAFPSPLTTAASLYNRQEIMRSLSHSSSQTDNFWTCLNMKSDVTFTMATASFPPVMLLSWPQRVGCHLGQQAEREKERREKQRDTENNTHETCRRRHKHMLLQKTT